MGAWGGRAPHLWVEEVGLVAAALEEDVTVDPEADPSEEVDQNKEFHKLAGAPERFGDSPHRPEHSDAHRRLEQPCLDQGEGHQVPKVAARDGTVRHQREEARGADSVEEGADGDQAYRPLGA